MAMRISLDQAVSEIRQVCEETESDKLGSPFFFVVGAGVSYPSVPLANQLIEQCKEIAKRHGRSAELADGSTLDAYSYWFAQALPHPRQRQKFLRQLIESKQLNEANLSLAHLLSSRRVTNLVVTTNFDDYVARALRLFGHSPTVCDHPLTVARIDPDRDDTQIVHVHGSFLFYDCCNLRAEVVGRALMEQDTSLTMIGLLDRILWSRSPLLVGYSGWDGDVVMSALRRRLTGHHALGQNIYWFCFDGDPSIELLPGWLQKHDNVRFVVPEPHLPPKEPDAPDQRQVRATGGTTLDHLKKLPASEVFRKLIDAFRVPAPKLFTDPLGCFASQLEDALPVAPAAWADDPYRIKRVVQWIRDAAKSLEKTLAIPVAESVLGDPQFAAIVGDLPANLLILVQSRANQVGYETTIEGVPRGAFTHYLLEALQDPASDVDKDGRISISEALLAANEQLARSQTAQSPAILGGDSSVCLFASRKIAASAQDPGKLHAVLVGIAKYKEPGMQLAGPTNDVARFKSVLETKNRLLLGGVSIHVCMDEQATAAHVVKLVKSLARQAKADDVVLLYFSGHGYTRDAKGSGKSKGRLERILVAFDYNGKGKGEIELSRVIQELASLKSRQRIIVLDAG